MMTTCSSSVLLLQLATLSLLMAMITTYQLMSPGPALRSSSSRYTQRGRPMLARGISLHGKRFHGQSGGLHAMVMSDGEDGVQQLDRISVHYVSTLDSGEEVDSSRSRGVPFNFTVGLKEVVPGFEKTVLGMKVGETRTARVPPEEAYGTPQEDLIKEFPAGTLPPGTKLDVGALVQLPSGATAVVVEVGEDGSFWIDANNILAGQYLNFNIKLLSKASPKTESSSGHSLVALTEDEMRKVSQTLPPMSQKVLLASGTEEAGTGQTVNGYGWDCKLKGVYSCALGGLPLFSSEHKFDSGSGWPSFYQPIDPDHIIERIDSSHGMVRIEVLCAKTGAHLGHVFDDGPEPTGKRYCINAAALLFEPDTNQPPPEAEKPSEKKATKRQMLLETDGDDSLFPQ